MFDRIKYITETVVGSGKYRKEFNDRVIDELRHLESIESEIEELRDEVETLDALRAAGVDNWEGFDFAMEIKNEGEI